MLKLLFFYRPDCQVCVKMNPILEDLQNEFKDQLTIEKINVNTDPDLALEYHVNAVPYLILLDEKDKILDIRVGLQPYNLLKSFITNNLKEV